MCTSFDRVECDRDTVSNKRFTVEINFTVEILPTTEPVLRGESSAIVSFSSRTLKQKINDPPQLHISPVLFDKIKKILKFEKVKTKNGLKNNPNPISRSEISAKKSELHKT